MDDSQPGAGVPTSSWVRVPTQVAYRQIRQNVAGLLSAYPGAGDRAVAACPEWTVRDAVTHLVQICWRVIVRFGGTPRPEPLPADGVELPELLAEWADAGERLERILADTAGNRGGVLVMDAFTHELDLRSALGVSPPAEHPAYPGALDVVVAGYSAAVTARGVPALWIETDGSRWTAGEGRPLATVWAHRHDLYRSLAGRRTYEQIARLSWSEDPRPWLPAFAWGPFDPPPRPVEGAIHEP